MRHLRSFCTGCGIIIVIIITIAARDAARRGRLIIHKTVMAGKSCFISFFRLRCVVYFAAYGHVVSHSSRVFKKFNSPL